MASKIVPKRTPIFILSDFRTGSTLLRYALDAHSQICCPAELRLARFCHIAFQVVELLAADGIASDGAEAARNVARVRYLIDGLMNSYCLRKRKSRWCEKSPGNVDYLYLLGSVFPDAQYICLYRNGLDQAASFLDMYGSARLKLYVERYRGNAFAAAIDRWCSKVEAVLAFEHAHPDMSVRITYERFVAAPEEELLRLMRFLEVDIEEGLSTAAFQTSHDRGPGDAKILGTRRVEGGDARSAERLDIEQIPMPLRNRFRRLSENLGYGR